MKHVAAIIIKFVMIAVILEIILGALSNLTFGDILYVSAVITVLAYIIGDLLILSAFNNSLATVADVGLAILLIYAFRYAWNYSDISFTDALVSALAIGIGEWLFHKYVAHKVFPDKVDNK